MAYNEQQQLAIAQRGRPLMIEAGAGTGKTTTIIGRVVSFLEEGVEPSSICMMTFTNKAAYSMQQKIIKKSTKGKYITVGTFHGVALQLLYKVYALLGIHATFKVFGTYEVNKLWQRALVSEVSEEEYTLIVENKLHKPAFLDSIYSRMKSGLYTVEEIMKVMPKAQLYDKYCGVGTLQRIFEKYEQKKQEHHGVDFCDILTMFNEILDNKVALNYIRNKFTHYFIDEYQDTSKLQAEILHKMLGNNPNVTVVGDPNQSIYSFLSANIHNMLEFTKQYSNAEVIKLNKNYRSTDSILNVTNRILQNKEAVYNPLHSGRDMQTLKQPIFHTYYNEKEEGEAVVRLIRHWLSKDVAPSEIAVLSRFSRMTYAIERALLEQNIPYVKYGGLAFNERNHVKKFLAILEVSMDPKNYLAWEEIIPLAPYIGIKLTDQVIAEMKTDVLWNWECMPTTNLGTGKRGKSFRQLWSYFKPFIDLEKNAFSAQDVLEAALKVFIDIYTYYAQNLGKGVKLGEEDHLTEGDDSQDYQLTNESILENHITDINFFVKHLQESRASDLKAMLGQFKLDSSIQDKPDEEKVVISTIHSAKGLEWENVVVLGLEDGIMPPQNREFGRGKYKAIERTYVEEEERLFYVAATRAKDELHMTVSSSRMGQQSKPSPFIVKFFDTDIIKLIQGKRYEKLNFATHKLYIKI